MDVPAFLTIPEAAAVLRIGRTVAYELAARYLETDGADGLPVVRIGKQLRVPRARLEALAGDPLTDGHASGTITTANETTGRLFPDDLLIATQRHR